MKKIIVIIALAALLCACGSNQTTQVTTAVPSTAASESVPPTTPAPTEPIETIAETEEPETAEILPIETYTGTGDTVVELKPRDDIWVFFVEGNSESRHFSVTGYDEDNDYTGLFVNTTSPYIGLTFDDTLSTSTLEVKATGDWSISQVPIEYMDSLGAGDTFNGLNDTVLIVKSYNKTAHITGNADGKHFAVKAYRADLHYDDLLVNTTDPYDGQVRLGKPAIFVITAVGDWSITLE